MNLNGRMGSEPEAYSGPAGIPSPSVTLAPDQPPRELREERLDAVYDRQTELKGRIHAWWSATWVHSSTRPKRQTKRSNGACG